MFIGNMPVIPEKRLRFRGLHCKASLWARCSFLLRPVSHRDHCSGVPTYVVFTAGADGGGAHVLPELLTRSVVLDAIRHNGS